MVSVWMALTPNACNACFPELRRMTHPYDALDPDCILDAVESAGLLPSGHILALNSYENRVYQIGIEDRLPVIAKFYRPARWSNAAILEEHQFSQELARQEIPVVAPMECRSETLLHHQGFRFALFPRQGGHAPELDNLDQLEWIGRFLGRIHRVGQAGRFLHRTTLDTAAYGWRAREIVLASPQLPAQYREQYHSVSSKLLAATEEAIQQTEPTILRLHGDCHPGNILWTDNGPHFVDMDDCCSGPAIQDLWMLLSGDHLDMTIQLDALLEGYRAFHDFDPAELALIEPLRGLRLIHYTGWLAQRWDDPAFPLAFPWFGEPAYWPGYLADLEEQTRRMAAPPLSLGY